jgi:macrolide transport system ATP-binding/permease protein
MKENSMELIELRNIYKTYHMGEIDVPVLKDVSLSLCRGEFVMLMGASGSGKTTLMNILGCLDRPTAGQYFFEGKDISQLSSDELALLRNQKIGFVFQNFNLLSRTSALENVVMPLTYEADSLTGREGRRRGKELLTRLGLEDRLHHEPSQLSGGEQQRVAIARSLVNGPSVMLADEPTGNLDSHTSEEVMDVFRKLNREEGITIICVTHNESFGRYATRVIRIEDGVIQPGEPCPHPSSPEAMPLERKPVEEDRANRWPKVSRVLCTALSGLQRNVLRAALTTLGIIIGVAAVIAMMEIGHGSSTAIQRTISSMGANNLLVLPGTASSGGVTFGAGSVMTLTPQDYEAIVNECSAVRAAAPIVRVRTQVIYKDQNWVPVYIYGTMPSFLDVRDWRRLTEGEAFTEKDVRNSSKVCLVGQRIVKELFHGQSPVGKEIRIQNVSFKVVGVLSSKGANLAGIDQDDIVLAPWTTIKYRVVGSSLGSVNQSVQASSGTSASSTVNTLNQIYPSTQNSLYPVPSAIQQANTPLPVRFTNVDQILTTARSPEDIPLAIKQITQILRERHRIQPGADDDFNIRDMTEMSKALSSTADMMTKLLLAVALISLVVGGVGIMNIMLVSVTERTREIGLRMAVGARRNNILQQFLVESVLLCFGGGVAGILVGRGASYVVTVLLRWPTAFSLDAILMAFAVSAAVGISFGYYPAWKASRLDPIIALRYE